MKRPNPTFLQKAENIRGKRRIATLILLTVLSSLFLVIAFVMFVASRQNRYSELYPDLVGRATDTTTTLTYATSSLTSATTTESSETTEETEAPLAPTIHTETTPEETGGETTMGLEPETLDLEDFHFSTPRSQVASHQRRAVLLDNMKNQTETYIRSLRNMRVCFQFISLKNNEALGINELEPIVPASTFALPINIISSEKAEAGLINPNRLLTYTGHSRVSGSYIYDTLPTNKQMYYYYVTHLSIAKSDRIALEYVLAELGGLDAIMPKINEISSFQPYDATVFYSDYSGTDLRGPGRSTCFDMARYAQYLYRSYQNNPSCYQNIINAMAYSDVGSPVRSAFGEETPILHIYGRNSDLHAYTELAIIDKYEPFIVCIYIEGENNSDVLTAFSTIGGYVNEFITSCY